jgi:hypothetical protein
MVAIVPKTTSLQLKKEQKLKHASCAVNQTPKITGFTTALTLQWLKYELKF